MTVSEKLKSAWENMEDYENHVDRFLIKFGISTDKCHDRLSDKVRKDLDDVKKQWDSLQGSGDGDVSPHVRYIQSFKKEVKAKHDYLRGKSGQRHTHKEMFIFALRKELPHASSSSGSVTSSRAVCGGRNSPPEPPVSKDNVYDRLQTLHRMSKTLMEISDFELYYGKESQNRPIANNKGPESFGSTSGGRDIVDLLIKCFEKLLSFVVKYPRAGDSFDTIISQCERAIKMCFGLCILPAQLQLTTNFQEDKGEIERVRGKIDFDLKALEARIVEDGSSNIYNSAATEEDSYVEETRLWNERAHELVNNEPSLIKTSDFSYQLITDKIESVLGMNVVLWRGEQESLRTDADDDAGGSFATTKKYVLEEETNVNLLSLSFAMNDPPMLRKFKVISDDTGTWRWLTKEVAVRLVKIAGIADKVEAERRNSIRIIREARVWSKMMHENIVPLLGMWLDYPSTGCPCPVSPWIGDYTLESFLATNRELPVEKRLHIVQRVASALVYMHNHPYSEVAHGDLKPDNILIDIANVKPYICDFGCSHLLDDIRGLSTEPHGNPRWLAPERVNVDPVDERYPKPTCAGDIYALGILLIHTAFGTRPFGNYTDMHIASKRAENLSMLPYKTNEIPKGFYEFVTQCWLTDSRMRPPATKCLEKIRQLSIESHD